MAHKRLIYSSRFRGFCSGCWQRHAPTRRCEQHVAFQLSTKGHDFNHGGPLSCGECQLHQRCVLTSGLINRPIGPRNTNLLTLLMSANLAQSPIANTGTQTQFSSIRHHSLLVNALRNQSGVRLQKLGELLPEQPTHTHNLSQKSRKPKLQIPQ